VIAEALPDELITQLSRLRWLFVIARGSSFRFRDAAAGGEDVRAALHVRYCLSGVVEVLNHAMVVSVELSDTQDSGVVWSERFQGAVDGVHEIREEIVRATVNAMELQIPLAEARAARLKAPEDLDAWSAYHLAQQHMYRFNKDDNAAATALLTRAIGLDPGFARAHAGLSFTHFQDALLSYTANVAEATQLAWRHAERSLELDPLDPFGNFTMGRSLLLRGDLEGGLPWLERANTLNPNYAQGKYSTSWAEALLGLGMQGRANADAALALSPLDPLRYAMLASRSFSHIVLDEPADAAHWADQAARSPGAHVLIDLIAVATHSLNGDDVRAQAWAQMARDRRPDVTRAHFFRAFPFRDARTSERISDALERHGF
jgi:TolB-like protein